MAGDIPYRTLLSLLDEASIRTPDASALHAPGRAPISYDALRSHVVRTAATLRAHGFAKTDVIAVAAPNGPELASAFLCVANACICAPLNPAYSLDEFDFYLSDLPAKALLIEGLHDSCARQAARAAGIPIIEIVRSVDDPAGLFSLEGSEANDTDQLRDTPDSDDVALVLHTSGTTSRPKIVPLTHANLSASARHVAATLELVPDDLCLNVMPLFHIHGLVAALLASLTAGAGVVCTPGFIAPSFFDLIDEFRPTWYTAVPTMHAAVASRADANPQALTNHSLRFIRSSSASLPLTTLGRLEELFGVPVVEAYGMTEAAHQMASNPLPPGIRKPGTVGPAAGPAIAVLDALSQPVPSGIRGEVAIRGPNVTSGYVRNEAANAAAFTGGWLRTGDEGAFDNDGYLTILGRLKEIINRGGEKISPLEVDEALLAHPAVAQAVTFGAKDALLGEEVAAAVVLRPGMQLVERQIREFVATRLATFKVPRRVLFMSAIPTGPTGKMQRIGMAERLGVAFDAPDTTPAEYVAPRTPVEEILASIWSSVMAKEPPGIHDNFFYSGGDSTLAGLFIARVRDALAVEISLIAFFDSPSVAGLATAIEESMAAEADGAASGTA